jgi:hypothetical protein
LLLCSKPIICLQEVEARDAKLAQLQAELAQLQQEQLALAQRSAGSEASEAAAVPLPLPVAENSLLHELQQQNSSLAGEVAQLREELAAAAALANASGAAAADIAALQGQLAAAQARVEHLEAELAAATAAAAAAAAVPVGGSHRSSSAGEEAAAAKLALAEDKIAQLMLLVQQQQGGAGGGVGASGSGGKREAELEAALLAAERDVAEAEAMAQEAMSMAEQAQVRVRALSFERLGILCLERQEARRAFCASGRLCRADTVVLTFCKCLLPASTCVQVELADVRGAKEQLEAEMAALQEQVGGAGCHASLATSGIC